MSARKVPACGSNMGAAGQNSNLSFSADRPVSGKQCVSGAATKPTYRECLEAGMSTTQTARARGVTLQAVSTWAKRNGVKFKRDYTANAERMRKLHADPEFAAAHAERSAERLRKLHADPEFAAAHAERMRKLHADPKLNPLVNLTEAERADYDALKRAGYTRKEAFRAIGRTDLVIE